nr:lysine-rich arabinogalactan protein 19-like [Lolium perenne]
MVAPNWSPSSFPAVPPEPTATAALQPRHRGPVPQPPPPGALQPPSSSPATGSAAVGTCPNHRRRGPATAAVLPSQPAPPPRARAPTNAAACPATAAVLPCNRRHRHRELPGGDPAKSCPP